MSEAKLDITGSTAVAQREVDKLTVSTAKLQEKIRQMNAEANKSAKDTSGWAAGMDRIRASNDKWAAGMKTINANAAGNRHAFDMMILKMQESTRVTNLVTSGVIGMSARFAAFAGPAAIAAGGIAWLTKQLAAFNEQSAAAVEHNKDFQAVLSKAITGGKDYTKGAEVEKFVKNIPGATKESGLEAYQGVSSQMPGSSFERRKAVAGAVARLGITGSNIGAEGVGGMAGFLAEHVLPNYKGEDVGDVAALLQREAGGDFEKLGGESFQRAIQQLVSSGAMSPEEALGTGLAAARGKMSGKTLTQLAKTAGATKYSIGGIGETGKVAAAKRRLGKMTPRERVQAMLSDKMMAEAGIGENAIELEKSRLSMADIQAGAAEISGVQGRDVIQEIRNSLATSEAGRGQATRYQTQATKQKLAGDFTRRDTLLAELDEQSMARDARAGFAGYAYGSLQVNMRRAMTFGGQMNSALGIDNRPNPWSGTDSLSIALLQQMVDAQRRVLQIEEQRSKARNVDAHTE